MTQPVRPCDLVFQPEIGEPRLGKSMADARIGYWSRRPLGLDRKRIIAKYRSGLTLRECAEWFGCSMQNIHNIVRRHARHLMRPPHVGMKRRKSV